MKIKNYLFVLAALVLATMPAWAQVTHITDDREMFIGVGDASKILPNIMVLADNSGSMNSAIYHPAYDPKVNYKVDVNGNALTLIENLANMTNWNGSDSSIRYLTATTTFNICRGLPHLTYTWDARGTFSSRLNNNPRRWKIYKNTFRTPGGVLYAPAVNQIIDYSLSGDTVGRRVKITKVETKTDGGGDYWQLTVERVYPLPAGGTITDPSGGEYVYINYHGTVDYTDASIAVFNEAGVPCTGYEQEFLDMKLFGTEESGNPTRYDENYLYWLAFFAANATDHSKLDEVTYWAASANGMFPDPLTGVLTRYGHYRIQVERQVLEDVVNEVYTTVNMGLAVFDSSNAGGRIEEPMSNMATGGTLNAYIGKIRNLLGETNTPLAETMADIWYYYKGGTGGTYWPNGSHGANSNCGGSAPPAPCTSSNFPTSCPIQYSCQKNYIIVMTDGESTQDKFDDAKYNGSIFRTSVVGPTGWGDSDNHDPNNTVGNTYCPNNSCWGANGTDYLDDMAWFLKHNDMFPDALYPCMPGDQSVETFAIGFNIKNDMLLETAVNGNGEFYKATSYDSLKSALKDAITNILLRNFGFAAFTAPKKISSIVGEGFSFIGYFLPSASEAIWTGHLQSYKMTDKWCPDTNGNHKPDGNECLTSWDNQEDCESASGITCVRSISLAAASEWDARDKLPDTRSLFTHDSSVNVSTLINFTDAGNLATLQALMGTTDAAQTQTVVDTLSAKILGDVFHSDIAYIGPPLAGKKFLKNLNPSDCGTTAGLEKKDDARCFEKLLRDQGATPGVDDSGRLKVIYVGTNEGILHQVNAKTGVERWGFIPDEVLPSLKKIVVDKEYTFTVDGRMTAEDIYYRGGTSAWKTILVFGLKDGGDSYYALDTTAVTAQPSVLWKFSDANYSGKSWSKPCVGKIRYFNGTTTYDRWVVIVAGGMAFNNEYTGDNRGKAVFVIDASSGQLIWMIGYNNASGADDNAGTANIETNTVGVRYLTKKAEFNYPIPSAITPVDRDSDGYLDTIYFGNVAGHLFKTDIASSTPANWKTFLLFKKDISTPLATSTVTQKNGTVITVANATGFALHKNVFGLTSKAMAIIDAVNNRDLTIEYRPTSAGPTFNVGETIVVPSFDPIFLSPAVAFDPCYNLWVAFGTGDRLRSRTNPTSGKFAAIRDGTTLVSSVQTQKTDILLSDLVTLTWTGNVINPTPIKVTGKWGWQFTFPDNANYEKFFDPEPLVLPDVNMVPHIYFNTYQPPLGSSGEDCNAPKEGMMKFYDLKMNYCGNGQISGLNESGRIAGGGMFQGSDFILYEGTGNVASIPPLQEIKPIKLIYTGGLLFWKEKKR